MQSIKSVNEQAADFANQMDTTVVVYEDSYTGTLSYCMLSVWPSYKAWDFTMLHMIEPRRADSNN